MKFNTRHIKHKPEFIHINLIICVFIDRQMSLRANAVRILLYKETFLSKGRVNGNTKLLLVASCYVHTEVSDACTGI